MNDTTFKLRVPTTELEEWKRKAGPRGLARWIRERCNEDLERMHSRDVGTEARIEADVSVHDEDKKTGKRRVCAHGIEKGYRCWQCGGIAVIDGPS